jgi:hypothetical protein
MNRLKLPVVYTAERREFGARRSLCACENCVTNCQVMPGYLIPADLARMKPKDSDVFAWAEQNLLASPGALVMKGGKTFRVNTLVPAKQPDGSCIHLIGERCAIHAVAPFGCAFFSCVDSTRDADVLSAHGLRTIMQDQAADGEYRRVWLHLDGKGLRSESAETLRERMRRKR